MIFRWSLWDITAEVGSCYVSLECMYWRNNSNHQVNLSEKTTIDYYSFFREICASYFQANQVKLGGPGDYCRNQRILFLS